MLNVGNISWQLQFGVVTVLTDSQSLGIMVRLPCLVPQCLYRQPTNLILFRNMQRSRRCCFKLGSKSSVFFYLVVEKSSLVLMCLYGLHKLKKKGYQQKNWLLLQDCHSSFLMPVTESKFNLSKFDKS